MVTDDSEGTDVTHAANASFISRKDRVARRRFMRTIGGTVAATSLVGCLGSGSENLPETIRIGALGPTDFPVGTSIVNAAKLAVEEINSHGGINGSKLELLSKDTKRDPEVAKSVYRELTMKENVDATVGIFGSEVLLALLPLIAKSETVHLGSGATTHEATRKVHHHYSKYKYFFRVGPPSSHYLTTLMLTFADESFNTLGWNRIAILTEESTWAESVTKELNKNFEENHNVEAITTEHISESTTDFKSIYHEIETEDIDGLFTTLAHIGTKSLTEWAALQPSFGYGGIHVPAQNPSYYGATNGAAKYTYTWTSATPKSEITEETIPFANSYHETFDEYLVSTGYITYDAVDMLKKAMAITNTTESEPLISELETMTHTGTTGEIEFTGKQFRFTHEVKVGPGFVHGVFFQWQEIDNQGEQVVIWPEKLATGTYEQPDWIQ